MTPLQKSRYLAYEDPPKYISEAQAHSSKRLTDLKKKQKKDNPPLQFDVVTEKDKHDKLIGQLKAAEARNRLRIMRLRYTSNRAQEVNHLISCQPSALKAVRLQALLPPYSDLENRPDIMDKLDRQRVECLLEDSQGLTTHRT
ncbi:protein LKAAEAR1-like isoform X2 [Tubulanus polymorphus]